MKGLPSFADPANLEPRAEPEAIELAADATPLQFLQAVYRSPNQQMQRRLKAAIEAAEFVHPRLAVTAMLNGGFAESLERALARSGKVIEAQAIKAE
jgi:hypothetical protein